MEGLSSWLRISCHSNQERWSNLTAVSIETGRFDWLVGQRQDGCFYRNTFVRSVFPTTQTKKVTKLTAQNLGRRGLVTRSEEHTSELQSRPHLVCRLLLEKKKKTLHRIDDDD